MLPADKQWGSLDENGSWTGIVGAMQNKVLVFILKNKFLSCVISSTHDERIKSHNVVVDLRGR